MEKGADIKTEYFLNGAGCWDSRAPLNSVVGTIPKLCHQEVLLFTEQS